MAYMEFEKRLRNDSAKVSVIYERALKALPPNLKEELMKTVAPGKKTKSAVESGGSGCESATSTSLKSA
jgi:hypothetical protein